MNQPSPRRAASGTLTSAQPPMYPPGVSLLAAPLYAVWPQAAEDVALSEDDIPWGLPQRELAYPEPPAAPAVLAAAAATAAAVGLLAIVFGQIGSPNTGITAGYLAGLGTAAWSVASDQLWQHGPAMLWVAAGVALAASRPVASGLAYGAAILTRPPTALIAAATGLYRARSSRQWKPALLIGSGAAAGMAVYLAYNRVMFGEITLSAGYGSAFEEAALESPGFDYLGNLFLAGFSFHRGLFVWSPFLLLLLPGLAAAWRAAPDWVRGSALGGVVYLLVQYKVNRYTGGFDFATYRYPLEGLTALAPLLYLAHRHWVSRWRQAGLAFLAVALLSVALQLMAAVGITPLLTPA